MTDTLWYTRCPVPTASGLAHSLGWLGDTAARNGLAFGVLQDAGPELAVRHFDHTLPGLIREGGNVPALAARAQGSPTRLIGLTWIDEAQAIVVGPHSPVASAAELAGLRVGIPAWARDQARSFPRAMALHGFANALRPAGLTLADVRIVELGVDPNPQVRTEIQPRERALAWGVAELLDGTVDAVYVKGAHAQEVAKEHGLRVAVDLDASATRALRVNNGTPRPLTVHQELLDTRPEAVIGFLAQTLRAADWATTDRAAAAEVLQRETLSGPDGVIAAYGTDFTVGLHPSLSPDRVELLAAQKQFLYAHGFLAADFDLDSWLAPEPLEQARALVAAGQVAA
ncbi:ABC transporter substrate-binding protein [Nocardia sp. NPDC004582]